MERIIYFNYKTVRKTVIIYNLKLTYYIRNNVFYRDIPLYVFDYDEPDGTANVDDLIVSIFVN